MADTKTSNDSQRDGGVLANLPRTRPQRSSARRAAARGATAPATRTRKATAGKPPQAGSNGAVASPSPARTAAVGGADRSPKAKSRVRATRPAAATKRSTAPRTAARKRRAQPIADAAPRQGFECDGETSGGSVQPPGGAEFVATAAEIVGELAKAGLSTGERLFKDVLSRLPLS